MDTRDTTEQAELRRTARALASELGPTTVADLDDTARRDRLAAATRAAGWTELRDDGGDAGPVASGVEAGIVVEALGRTVADVPLVGPLLAADLARRAGLTIEPGAVLAFAVDLQNPGAALAVDAAPGATRAYAMLDGRRLAPVECWPVVGGTDLTRAVAPVGTGPGSPVGAPIGEEDLAAWGALGLALTAADLVGSMRGVIDLTVAYASERRQFGVPVGSFQAVQHLLAEAHCLVEGAHSATLHATWAVDALDPSAALEAGRVAKAYAARAARTVGETAVQVHGGIGNTWECMVHVFLRRALLSAQWFGDDGVQLRAIAAARTGGADGLP